MDTALLFSVWWYAPLLFIIGIFVGINNVLAGGGSLITIPLLIFMGIDPIVSNGTNRLALVIQNFSAVSGFRKKGIGDMKLNRLLTLPALPGVIAGAVVASRIEGAVFKRILSVVMILMMILILTKRSSKAQQPASEGELNLKRKIAIVFTFAGIGFYSGFIQAGVGFIVIGALTWLTDMDLVKINAHKVFLIGCCTLSAALVFAVYGKILWSVALVLSAGNAIGGRLGSHAAIAGGEKWIKRVLVVAVIAMAVKLSGILG